MKKSNSLGEILPLFMNIIAFYLNSVIYRTYYSLVVTFYPGDTITDYIVSNGMEKIIPKRA